VHPLRFTRHFAWCDGMQTGEGVGGRATPANLSEPESSESEGDSLVPPISAADGGSLDGEDVGVKRPATAPLYFPYQGNVPARIEGYQSQQFLQFPQLQNGMFYTPYQGVPFQDMQVPLFYNFGQHPMTQHQLPYQHRLGMPAYFQGAFAPSHLTPNYGMQTSLSSFPQAQGRTSSISQEGAPKNRLRKRPRSPDSTTRSLLRTSTSGSVLDGPHMESRSSPSEADHSFASAHAPEEFKPRRRRRRLKSWSSKYQGVSWHKRDKRWTARIWNNCKSENLGSFESEELAGLVVDRRVIQVFGPEAGGMPLNFPDKSQRQELAIKYNLTFPDI